MARALAGFNPSWCCVTAFLGLSSRPHGRRHDRGPLFFAQSERMLHYLQLVTSSLAATVETAILTSAMRLRLMGGARDGCRPKLHRWPFSCRDFVPRSTPLRAPFSCFRAATVW